MDKFDVLCSQLKVKFDLIDEETKKLKEEQKNHRDEIKRLYQLTQHLFDHLGI